MSLSPPRCFGCSRVDPPLLVDGRRGWCADLPSHGKCSSSTRQLDPLWTELVSGHQISYVSMSPSRRPSQQPTHPRGLSSPFFVFGPALSMTARHPNVTRSMTFGWRRRNRW